MFIISIKVCRETKKPLSLWCSSIWKAVIPSALLLFLLVFCLTLCKDTNFICAKQIFVCFLVLIKQIHYAKFVY